MVDGVCYLVEGFVEGVCWEVFYFATLCAHYRTLCEGLLGVFVVCSFVLLNTPGQ